MNQEEALYDSEDPSSSDNDSSSNSNPVELDYAPEVPAEPLEPLEPLAGSSTDAPSEPPQPLAGSSTDAPFAVVADEACTFSDAPPAVVLVEKVLSLLQRAKARNKLAPAVEFLRQRVGLHLPSLGGQMLTLDAFDEALNTMSTKAD